MEKKRRYILYTDYFTLYTDEIKDVYKSIKEQWNVQSFQVKFLKRINGNDEVILTNKLGEDFASIGFLERNEDF